ncbi:Clavaminate synthase-like protein [Xylariaceae sp. FL1272]|nr:Clavaminate synthase-like protein [Xylariaceae sp. FL1272]
MASAALFKDIPPFPDDVPTASMPVISFGDLRKEIDAAEKAVLKACKETGFFLLDLGNDSIGTRLVSEIDQLFGVCKETMNLPDEVKNHYQNDAPKSLLGFKPIGQANTEKGEPDRYEWLNIGQDGLMATDALQPLPPSMYPYLPLFISYVRHCQHIVAILSLALARQLGLPEDTFTARQSPTEKSGTVLRLLKCYASPESEGLRTSLIHHTDFGTITLLANIVGGLQILKRGGDPLDDNDWAWARPQPGCLIVNMGDAMAQWTGGVLHSCIHRVRHAPGDQRFVDRYSIAYLARPELSASMKRLLDFQEGSDNEDDGLTAREWEVKKSMGLMRASTTTTE